MLFLSGNDPIYVYSISVSTDRDRKACDLFILVRNY